MNNKKRHFIFTGTGSNAGKTFIAGFIGKILKENFGMNVCPFKAQNMSNYASVCETNKEISIAQASQAELMNVIPLADMNPVLLKPLGEGCSQLIVRGVPQKITSVRDYYKEIDTLKSEVDEAFNLLQKDYETVIIEGAGSCLELNLKDRDLANQHMMQKENVYSVLVANIENGGVFPSIYGTYNLMSKEERKRFKGVIINNFRGDISLFDEGKEIIEKWRVPVLGVIPNINYGLDAEDSLSDIQSYEKKDPAMVNIGVIKYPRTSNMNDVEPLVHDPAVQVTFITQRTNLDIFDKIVLPGSRAVLDDLRWLKRTGLFEELNNTSAEIYGICGGYQMMHEEINDPLGTESSSGQSDSETGLGLIPGKIEFMPDKILKRQDYTLHEDIQVHGFEMHTGISDNYPLFYNSDKVKGSMIHEIFNNDNFRQIWLSNNTSSSVKEWDFKAWKKQVQDKTALIIKEKIDWNRLLNTD